jgi:hypothetical protein
VDLFASLFAADLVAVGVAPTATDDDREYEDDGEDGEDDEDYDE